MKDFARVILISAPLRVTRFHAHARPLFVGCAPTGAAPLAPRQRGAHQGVSRVSVSLFSSLASHTHKHTLAPSLHVVTRCNPFKLYCLVCCIISRHQPPRRANKTKYVFYCLTGTILLAGKGKISWRGIARGRRGARYASSSSSSSSSSFNSPFSCPLFAFYISFIRRSTE